VSAEGQKLRMEMTAEGQTIVYLTNYATMKMYVYYPSQNMAMEMDIGTFAGAATDAAKDIEQYDPTILGTETLDGKVCLVVQYNYSDQGKNVMAKIWIWKQYGFAIRTETTIEGVTTTMEVDNIVFGDIDNSQFEIPTGVMIINM
jgi:outer membrane lipoprotein-sorting protein